MITTKTTLTRITHARPGKDLKICRKFGKPRGHVIGIDQENTPSACDKPCNKVSCISFSLRFLLEWTFAVSDGLMTSGDAALHYWHRKTEP